MADNKEFRVFIIGDHTSGTGPAIVTKELIRAMPKGTISLKTMNKLSRALEIARGIPAADAVLFSGYSRQNLYGMRLAHFFGKKCAYLMHGCVEYENEINRVPDAAMARDERRMLAGADLILGVSRQFEQWLKERYLAYKDKISHLTNGIDWELFTESAGDQTRDPRGIISVGGGMPRKKIVNLCKALQKLKDEGLDGLTLTVAGDEGADSGEIDSFEFVNNVGLVPHEKLIELYHKNKLFIQNSCFETFGLAPLEALLSGADILVSSKCGVLSVIKKTEPQDIIGDTEDISEIAEKIKALLSSENHTRLICELDKESTSWKRRSEELMKLMKDLAGSGNI